MPVHVPVDYLEISTDDVRVTGPIRLPVLQRHAESGYLYLHTETVGLLTMDEVNPPMPVIGRYGLTHESLLHEAKQSSWGFRSRLGSISPEIAQRIARNMPIARLGHLRYRALGPL